MKRKKRSTSEKKACMLDDNNSDILTFSENSNETIKRVVTIDILLKFERQKKNRHRT